MDAHDFPSSVQYNNKLYVCDTSEVEDILELVIIIVN